MLAYTKHEMKLTSGYYTRISSLSRNTLKKKNVYVFGLDIGQQQLNFAEHNMHSMPVSFYYKFKARITLSNRHR